jgi:hypothetical protein
LNVTAVAGSDSSGKCAKGIFAGAIERAITSYELAAAYRALFDIATRHMELAHKNSAIMAGYCGSVPVAMFFAVTDARNVSPLPPNETQSAARR